MSFQGDGHRLPVADQEQLLGVSSMKTWRADSVPALPYSVTPPTT